MAVAVAVAVVVVVVVVAVAVAVAVSLFPAINFVEFSLVICKNPRIL